jgi:hypothetical protein
VRKKRTREKQGLGSKGRRQFQEEELVNRINADKSRKG